MSDQETSIVEDMEVIRELIREAFPDYLPHRKLDIKEEVDRIED